MLFYAIISSVVYLRCRMRFSAKPMNRKRFWSCLLSNGERKTRANESRAKFTWSMPNAAEFL